MDANKEYPNNYLNEVIFKIEYSPILELYGNNPRVAGSFQSAIYEKFPNVKIKRNKEITFNIDPQSGKPMSTTDEGHLLWIFDSGNGETVELTATSLSLSYEGNAYVSFDEFLKDIMLLIDSIKIYPVKNFSFIGLRYINQFDDFDLKKLNDYINENLHVINKEFNEGEVILQSMSRVDLQINDFMLKFQYGVFNPDYPEYNEYNDFILDFDCYLKKEETLESINDNLINMHDIIHSKFETEIKDKLREKMKGE